VIRPQRDPEAPILPPNPGPTPEPEPNVEPTEHQTLRPPAIDIGTQPDPPASSEPGATGPVLTAPPAPEDSSPVVRPQRDPEAPILPPESDSTAPAENPVPPRPQRDPEAPILPPESDTTAPAENPVPPRPQRDPEAPIRGGGGQRINDGEALQERAERLEDLADEGGLFADLHDEALAALARGDLDGAGEALDRAEWYRAFIDAGPRGSLLSEINAPSDAEFDELISERDIHLDGGETSRRYFEVGQEPGRGLVAFDFFIPEENSLGLRGDDRPEEGTNVLRSDLDITDSRVMIVIDFETGRGVIGQSETKTDVEVPDSFTTHDAAVPVGDIPLAPDGANEPRPVALNGDRGAWSHEGGIDLDETQQINIESDGDGLHVDWDILNQITPLIISVDGDVDFTEGDDGFLHTDDFTNQDLVDRYPQIQVYQYLPHGSAKPIGRNDHQGGAIPVQGALPHCDLPDGPTISVFGREIVNLPDGPSVPGPC
jgi:hypothetical protein